MRLVHSFLCGYRALFKDVKRPYLEHRGCPFINSQAPGNDGRVLVEGIWLAACEMRVSPVRVAHVEPKPMAPEIRLSLDMQDAVLSSASVPRYGLVPWMMRLGAGCLG